MDKSLQRNAFTAPKNHVTQQRSTVQRSTVATFTTIRKESRASTALLARAFATTVSAKNGSVFCFFFQKENKIEHLNILDNINVFFYFFERKLLACCSKIVQKVMVCLSFCYRTFLIFSIWSFLIGASKSTQSSIFFPSTKNERKKHQNPVMTIPRWGAL